MKTPFFGETYIAQSKNLADNACINLYPELAPAKTGQAKAVGAFFATPGLTLKATIGNGPVRGMEKLGDVLYAVSENGLYSLNVLFGTSALGTIGSASGPVSIVKNPTQLVIFDGVKGYLVPGGFPLSGGTVGSGGSLYQAGDTINLQAADGGQIATAVLTVASVTAGAVATFTVTQTGVFDPKPTSFTQNQTTGSGNGFTLTLPTYGAKIGFYTLSLPFAGPVYASYQDGFGLVNVAGTDQWYQSGLFDLSFWDPLNFSSADSQPDDIQAIADLHREVYLFKDDTTEVWINAGIPGFAFQRLEGVFLQMGCIAPFSVALTDEVILWLGQNQEGSGIVFLVTGYEPKRISTHAIEQRIQSYPTMTDAIGYPYQQNGHTFYVLTFPSGNETWVFDLTTGMWHQRAAWSNGEFSRHAGNCHAFFAGLNLVGDYESGNIYALDLGNLTDNGAQRKWVRSWRALAEPQYQPVRFSALQIDMQTGINVPDGTNPQVFLDWSDDGGHNFSNEIFEAAGPPGKTAQRVVFRRLGTTRRNSGLDRIFRLSSADQFPVALIGAELT